MGIVVKINRSDKPEVISDKITKSLKSNTVGFPAEKFLGKMKIGGTPVENQRKTRNEW
jgi:hypothetical protein